MGRRHLAVRSSPALRARGLRPAGRSGRIVVQSFLRHAMRDGFFHADMHQGNLFVDARRQARRRSISASWAGSATKERRFLAEILYGFITRDYKRVAEVHFEAGYVPRKHRVEDFAQAIRAIGEPIHSRTADQISMAKLLTLLFEITGLFDMHTRTELVMLQKTMVVVEGVARSLDPKLDLWATSEPVVRGWIEENLGPLGKMQDVGVSLHGALQCRRRAARTDDARRTHPLQSGGRGRERPRPLRRDRRGLARAQMRRIRLITLGTLDHRHRAGVEEWCSRHASADPDCFGQF